MIPEPDVILLVCPHLPHTNQVRVDCQPPKVIFSGCEECAKKFYDACLKLGGEAALPKFLL